MIQWGQGQGLGVRTPTPPPPLGNDKTVGHAYQTLECSTSGRILNTIPPGRESKIGECHATDYAFLRFWYKFEVRKFSRFVRFTFRVK